MPSERFITGDLITKRKLAIGDGYRAKNSELSPDGLPFARAGNIDGGFNFDGADCFPIDDLDRVGDKISRPGDVVFTSKGTVGRLAFVRPSTPRFVYAPQLCYWRSLDINFIDDLWLFYWMSAAEFRTQMLGVKGQTDMADYVSLSDQRRMKITLPHIRTQRAVAAVLGSLDDKIEQNRRTGAKLEELARAVFKAWFVDFEPVKAKAAGATAFPGMPPETFATLPTRFVDSELGPVPEGWEVKPLSKVVKLTMGQSPKSEFYNEEGMGLPFHQGVTDYGFRFPTDRVFCTVEGRLAGTGDILLSVRAPVGRINVAGRRMILGRGLAGLRHLDDQQAFLLYQMFQVFAEEDAIGDGTIYKAVNKDYLAAMSLIVPPKRVRDVFETIAKPMDALIMAADRESAKLAALRDYLLPKLLSGRVRVNNELSAPEFREVP